MQKPEIDMLNELFSLAQSFLDSGDQQYIELAHYVVDNALEKLIKVIGKDQIPNFDSSKHPRTKKFWDFPQLVSEVLVPSYPKLASIKKDLITRHKDRNFFQHNDESLLMSLRKQVAEHYLQLLRDILEEVGIFKSPKKIAIPRTIQKSGGKLKDMLNIAPDSMEMPLFDENGRQSVVFSIKVTNNGPYAITHLRVKYFDGPNEKRSVPCHWARYKTANEILPSLGVGRSERIILCSIFDNMNENINDPQLEIFIGCGDSPVQSFCLTRDPFSIEISATNAENVKYNYSLIDLFKQDPLYSEWELKVMKVNCKMLANYIQHPYQISNEYSQEKLVNIDVIREIITYLDSLMKNVLSSYSEDIFQELDENTGLILKKYREFRMRPNSDDKNFMDLVEYFGWNKNPWVR